jgi:Rad3-related DNA helicase
MSFLEMIDWLKTAEIMLSRIINHEKFSNRITRAFTELEKVQSTLLGVMNSPSSYVHDYDKDTGDLVVYPISPPTEVLQKILQCDRLILMSATLYERDVVEITNKKYVYKEFESPIDASRRVITVKEGCVPNMNYKTPPEIVAQWIKDRLSEYKGLNTLVHVTYNMSKKLRPFLKGVLFNTPENKNQVLNTFKEKGGVWVAAGCAEGIDLPGKQCELILIPILPSPNIEDPVYKRRLALPYGQEKYDIRVLKTVQQQSGRATRNPDDSSLAVIGSRRYINLVSKYRSQLPIAYQEQIWRNQTKSLKM